MPAWGSLSLLEAVWLLVAVGGSIYSAINLRTALGDRDFIFRANLNGGRRLIAAGNVRQEALLLLPIVSCLLLGVYAALPTDWQAPFRGWLSPLLLIVIVVSLAANSYSNQRQRATLQQMLRVFEYAKQRNATVTQHKAGEHPG